MKTTGVVAETAETSMTGLATLSHEPAFKSQQPRTHTHNLFYLLKWVGRHPFCCYETFFKKTKLTLDLLHDKHYVCAMSLLNFNFQAFQGFLSSVRMAFAIFNLLSQAPAINKNSLW